MTNAKAAHIFSAKVVAYMPYLLIRFNDTLTNDIVNFEQLDPESHNTALGRHWIRAEEYEMKTQNSTSLKRELVIGFLEETDVPRL